MPKAIRDEFSNLPVSRQRKYQLRRIRDGECPSCGKPSPCGVSHFPRKPPGWWDDYRRSPRPRKPRGPKVLDEFTHLDVSRSRKQQLRRIRDGLCAVPRCSDPRDTSRHCRRHADEHAARVKSYQARNPDKVFARGIVARAIIQGRLIRQKCERCDLPGQAHHEDYSKPLEVRWLCRKHHYLHHREHGQVNGEQLTS